MNKNITKLLFSAALLLCCTFSAWADLGTPPNNEIWYSTNNGGTAENLDESTGMPKYPKPLNAYMGSHGVQFFNGNPPEFSDNGCCFRNCFNLVSAILPSSITFIGVNAFKNCYNLVSVSLPSTVTGIEEDAFSRCSSLQDIKLPAGLNSIGICAFGGCSSLQSITIPSGVKTITGGAFRECIQLRSMTILGTIQNIHGNAFSASYDLSEIYYLGDGTPDLGQNCFLYCPATIYVKDVADHGNWGGRPVRSWRQQLGTDAYPTFSGIYFVNYTSERQYYNNETSQEIWYTSKDGKIVTPYNSNFFEAGVTSNTYRGGQGVITFDKKVTSIGNQAFRECSSLKSIEIPDNVTSIGQFAFFSCSSLQGINIPSGVTSIGEFAFRYCSILQSITIPSGVTSIGMWALADCNNMESITFKSLPSISNNVFYNNSSSSKVLDLTDSEKPYIGNSLNAYHPFTEARYHGTLEPGKWGTITLPFVPTSHQGIVFFSIDNVDAANGTLTLSIVENIVAGKPYLFRNQTDAASFTLTAMPAASATDVPVTITASEQTVGDFALKGTFQAKELTETGLYEQQDGEFVKVGSLSINPFHAYLQDTGGSAATSIAINCDGVLVTITNQDDSTVTLYGLKKVEFLKENNVPSVRVTYADNSTMTYENPKKVEFGK